MKRVGVLLLVVWLAVVSAGRGDTFFVTEPGVNSIAQFDQEGNRSVFTSAFVSGPTGIALDHSGNVYVATGQNAIRIFSPAGIDLGVFASDGINDVSSLIFDAFGNLYAANYGSNNIQKFTPDGSGSNFANIIGPTGMAFDSQGNLYVANFGNTIEIFSPTGAPLGTFANTGLNNPQGLAFDSLGNLFVANQAANTIEKFSPLGVDLGVFARAGLSFPKGLAFDHTGLLYAVNSGNATIARFSPDGTFSQFAATDFSPAFLAVQQPATLANISTRANVQTGEEALDAGFIISGVGTKTILIRGLGPSLTDAGLTNPLTDPTLELHSQADGSVLATNDNWRDTQASEIDATGIPPTKDVESAIIISLPAAAYSVIERGKDDRTGVGLLEVYDLGSGFGPELANVSTRGLVGTGTAVMIAGFISSSSSGGAHSVLARALGPSLGQQGVLNPLGNPSLELYDANGVLLASNDNWKSEQQDAIEATGIPPPDDSESAILITLAPGAYTAITRGVANATGVALLEIYNLR